MTMRDVLRELSQSRIVRPQRPAKLAEIRAAEKLLGVSFPPVYVEFLKLCGVLNIYDRGVYGLGPYTHRRDRETATVTFQTQYQRDKLGLPKHFVVVWDESHMDCTCLDTRHVKGGDCPVVCYDPEAKTRVRKLAPTFGAWLRIIVAKQEATKKMLDVEMPGKLTAMGGIRIRRRKKAGGKRT